MDSKHNNNNEGMVKSVNQKQTNQNDTNNDNNINISNKQGMVNSQRCEDPAIQSINSTRKINEDDIKAGPFLILKEEKDNINLFHNKEIKINPGGMIGGRNIKDGITIFGLPKTESSNSNNNNNNSTFKVDFELNYNTNKHYPYVFMIFFKKESKEYFIRSYYHKTIDSKILFVQLNTQYNIPIKSKEIISAGNSIFQLSLVKNKNLEIINLSIKEQGECPKTVFDQTKEKQITIGRDKQCTISYPKDKSFSRIQTTIKFEDDLNEWIIYDGNIEKASTNGTWVFGIHSFPIKDGMIAEILTTKVKFSIMKE